MCGDIPDIHTDAISPMYAIGAPRREMHNPLEAMAAEGPACLYRRRETMLYRNEDLDALNGAYAHAAQEASSYMSAWRQMQYHAGSN